MEILVKLNRVALVMFLAICSGGVATATNGVVLDFSQSQFDMKYSQNIGFMLTWTVSNRTGGPVSLMPYIKFVDGPSCTIFPNPQGQVDMRAGETVWFKEMMQSCINFNPGTVVTFSADIGYSDVSPGFSNSVSNLTVERKTLTFRIDTTTDALSVHLRGTVVDAAGKPMALARVWSIYGGGMGGYTSTAADGSFDIPVQPTPEYWIYPEVSGYRTAYRHVDASQAQTPQTIVMTKVRAWQIRSSLAQPTLHRDMPFWGFGVSKDQRRVVVTSSTENPGPFEDVRGAKAYLFDTTSWKTLWEHPTGWFTLAVDLSDDGKWVAYGAGSEPWATVMGLAPPLPFLYLLDADTASVVWTLPTATLPGNDPNMMTPSGQPYSGGLGLAGVKFSHDGRYIFTVAAEQGYMLARDTGKVVWWKNHLGAFVTVFSNDDRYLYASASSGYLYKLEAATGQEVWRQFVGSWAYHNGLNLSADESRLCYATKSGDLGVLKTNDGSIVFSKAVPMMGGSCGISPDGSRVILGGSAGGLSMHDITGKELWRRAGGKMGRVNFSADGKLVGIHDRSILDVDGTLVHVLEVPIKEQAPTVWGPVAWLNSDFTRAITGSRDLTAAGQPDLTVMTLEIAGQETADKPAPSATDAGVVNSASFSAATWVAPGEIISIFGSNLGPTQPLFGTWQNGQLSTTLGGVRVLFAGISAPLVYVSSTQINAVAPFSLGDRDLEPFVVERDGVRSAPVLLRYVACAPGVYRVGAFHGDFSQVTPTNPAAPGSVVALFATGFGQTNPPSIDAIAAGAKGPQPVAPFTFQLGGRDVSAEYLGNAPFAINGLMQVNLRIPDDTPPGGPPLAVRCAWPGGLWSTDSINIPIGH